MKASLYVGPSPEAVRAARDAIIAVLKVDRSDDVTIYALGALTIIAEVKDTTISNNVFGKV